MRNVDEMRKEVTSMLASCLVEAAAEGFKAPIGDTGDALKHIGYLDGDSEIWLRTEGGEVWIVRAERLNSWVQPPKDPGHYRMDEVRESHKRYKALCAQWTIAKSVFASANPEGDLNLALQAYVEEVLSPDERECWFRWSPGGHATKQEWHLVGGED